MPSFVGPVKLAIAGSFVVVVLIFLLFRFVLLGTGRFDMDPQGKDGAFEPRAKRYQEIAKLVLTLSTASIAFIVNFLVGLPADIRTRGRYSIAIEAASPLAITFLCVSVLSALLFLLSLSSAYERYSHSPDKDTYGGNWYALNYTLGYPGLLWFFFAYAWLAHGLFR
jgi:hypothetical protein